MKAIFPYFESGLPLRSRDLNAIYRRADEEVRHTRTCLHGMGIFYGLKVTPKENKLESGAVEQLIEVSAGAGVTSQGFLYCAHEAMTLKFSKTITIEKDHFTTKGFTDFLDTPIKGLVPATIAAEQLGTNAEELGNSTAILDQKLWADKLLVIFFEINKETLNGCATCEKGTKAELATKFLLVDKIKWAELSFICTDSGINTTTPFNPVLLNLPRFGLNDSCVTFSQISSENALNTAYAVTTKSSIQTALKDLIEHYSRLFNDDATISKAAVDALIQLSVNSQYHHDYWRLIVRAYNEFASTSFAQSFAGLPPETCFPKHLIVGEFDAKGVLVESSSIRTKLYRPPFDDATDADFATAQSLYYRLIAIVKHHRLSNLPNEGIRVTPSRRPTHPLSNQAIPYYLNAADNTLLSNWRPNNPFKTAILSYDNTNRLQNQPYFDEADFYRIEGHIGKGAVEVRDALLGNKDNIQGLRKCLNLPFEVVFVSLQNTQFPDIMTLSAFASQNNGLEHQGGVPSGGTFVLVLDTTEGQREAKVVADFCLPYWVQPAVEPIVADFIVTQKGNTFSFDATPSSKNTHRLRWSTNKDEDIQEGLFSVNRVYNPKLALGKQETSKHFFIKLEAFTVNGQKDVEITTVVLQRQVEIPDRVVAQFDVVKERTTILINRVKMGETIEFVNKSSANANKLEWSFNDTSVTRVDPAKHIFNFLFSETDIDKTEKDFVVTLKATNEATNESDIEEITLTIRRELLPVAKFKLTDSTGVAISSIIGQNDINANDLIIRLRNPIQPLSFTLAFDGRDSENEKTYNWSLTKSNQPGTIIATSSAAVFSSNLFQWSIEQQRSLTYNLELTVTNGLGLISTPISKMIHLELTFSNGTIDTPVNTLVVDTLSENRSIVEPADALRSLRTRHRDYRKAIEQAATDTPDLAKIKSYQSVIGFITGFQDDIEKLEKQDGEFKKHALHLIQNIKRTGGIKDSVYQTVLKNMVFFYLDKLSHILPDGLTAGVNKTLKEFFTKAQSEQSFSPQQGANLSTEWQANDIRTEQNTKVIDELNRFFEL